MADLIEFLTARIAEDERLAFGALRGCDEVTANCEVHEMPSWLATAAWRSDYERVLAVRTEAVEPYVETLTEVKGANYPAAGHIARHDPARVLREVEAKRRIVDLHAPVDGYCTYCLESESDIYGRTYAQSPCMDLRLLALPYADHPEFEEEWKP